MNDQRSLTDQLRDAVRLCNEAGMYDAADAIERTFRRRSAVDLSTAETVMPIVNGKRFACSCGANVFTKVGDVYRCNGCPNEYQGEPVAAGGGVGDAAVAPGEGTGS